jgi:hypothetical protein
MPVFANASKLALAGRAGDAVKFLFSEAENEFDGATG